MVRFCLTDSGPIKDMFLCCHTYDIRDVAELVHHIQSWYTDKGQISLSTNILMPGKTLLNDNCF